MRNLLKLLYTYNYLILFLVLEGFSLFLVIEGSEFHHARFVNSTRSFSGAFFVKMNELNSYFGLKEQNAVLAHENVQLKNLLEQYRKREISRPDTIKDTLRQPKYSYFEAKVINNSVNKQYNYITLDKGSDDGVRPEMGVISAQGIVGVVQGVSKHFATVISVLNLDFKVSAKIKKNDFFGQLHWDGISDSYCTLTDIPQHVKFGKGDTIVTTGFSSIFPNDITIGTVESFDIKGGNFFTIKVKLFNEFRKLNYVTIVDDIFKEERKSLENTKKND